MKKSKGKIKVADKVTRTGDTGSIRISIVLPIPMLDSIRKVAATQSIGYQTFIKLILSQYLTQKTSSQGTTPFVGTVAIPSRTTETTLAINLAS